VDKQFETVCYQKNIYHNCRELIVVSTLYRTVFAATHHLKVSADSFEVACFDSCLQVTAVPGHALFDAWYIACNHMQCQ
jgi:hypothetical protein